MHHRLANCPERDDQSLGMRADWQRLHRIFHRTLIAACGSEWLIRFHDLLYDQMIRYRSLAGAFQLDLRRNVRREHAAIVDAVIARDPDAAAAAIETHYMTTANLLVEVPRGDCGTSSRG